MLTVGGLAASTAFVCHHLQESTQREHQAAEWTSISELLRDDIRAAARVEWLAPQGADVKTLRLLSAAGRVIEYSIERKTVEVFNPPIQKTKPKRTIPPGPPVPPAPQSPEAPPKATTIVLPPVLTRSAGDSKSVKPTHRFEYYDIARVERSKPGGGIWELSEMQSGESVDAAAARTFFMIGVEFQSPHKAKRAYSTGAATRLDVSGERP